MPWKSSDAKKHIKGLTPSQESTWADVANSVLKTCEAKGGSDCEGKAIRIANSKAKGNKSDADDYIKGLDENEDIVETFASSVKVTEISKLKTEQTDEGLLIKGVPVFKAGTYRETEYSTDYIDRNFIGQFNDEEDVPIQADHNPSCLATLGWVKGLSRKAKVMYADMLLSDENAIARWKKGLMKKFSIGVDLINDKIREISFCAFPYVKSARVHSDDISEDNVGENVISATEVNGHYFVQIEGEQFEATKSAEPDEDGNFWFWFPISRRDKDGEIEQEEHVNIDDETIDNIDIKEDIDLQDICEVEELSKTLPDSAFLLTKKPVRDRNGDRALPIRNEAGKISISLIKSALTKVDKLKGFSSTATVKAKARLTRIAKKLGIEKESHKSEEEMKLNELKKLDLTKLGEGGELLKEAIEQVELAEQGKTEAEAKLDVEVEKNKTLSAELRGRKVSEHIKELKDTGKITPAQEESTKAFLETLSDENIEAFVKVMSNAKAQVDLSESGEQDEEEKTKGKLDIDKLEAADINKVAEALAKENDVSFDEALDWCYDGKVSDKGKLLQ